MVVVKRDGTKVPFDSRKIVNAIRKAFVEVEGISANAITISNKIAAKIEDMDEDLKVEEIQDLVEHELMQSGFDNVAKAYIIYRNKRSEIREKNSAIIKGVKEFVSGNNEYLMGENSNKNPRRAPTQRDYFAGIVSKEIMKIDLPDEIVDAHSRGQIHFHDSDYYISDIHNCDLINLNDMLQNGTVISETGIDKPHSFSTACTIATQIIAQVASSQYGGQSITLSHLAPFVDVSRQHYRKEVVEELAANGIEANEEVINNIVEERVKGDIARGVQTIQYQVITLMTTNGQAPFITVFMDINEVPEGQTREDLVMVIEEVLRQRIRGVKNEQGAWISPAFPKLIYALDDNNVYPGSKYYHVTELAAKCSAKRLVPDYISAKKMREYKNGDVYPSMGCRSFLTPWHTTGNPSKALDYVEGQPKYYGRFNQGVVTVNLPYLACMANGDMDKFWEVFDETMNICHKALRCRHEKLRGTKTEVAPILWQYGALARLSSNDTIDKLLYNGYSTISLGYAGLYECVKKMTGGEHYKDAESKKFAFEVMNALNDYCARWKEAENIDYSLYGTPLESTTEKFAKALKRDFGENIFESMGGNQDRDYITNSYHVPVWVNIDPFEKLAVEAEFQKLSPGGAISYIETDDMTHNTEAVLEVIKFIYENIMYAELNTKSDYCQICGYSGEIKLVENEKGQRIWKCPNCGNTDTQKLDVARRTCGYIGTARNGWNQGRLGDIGDRVPHLTDMEE